MVCTSLGSLLRPLFYFLCSNLKANPVLSRSCICFSGFQYWWLTAPPESRLQRDYVCIGLSSLGGAEVPVLRDCNDDVNVVGRWTHDPASGGGRLRHLESGKCLKLLGETSKLVMEECDGRDEGQGVNSIDIF